MKKLVLAMMISVPVVGWANMLSETPHSDATIIPGPGGKFLKVDDAVEENFTPPELASIAQMNDEIYNKQKTYLKEKSPYPVKLLNLGRESSFKADDKTIDIHDTSIKKNLSQIKLAFPFKPLSMVANKDVKGYQVANSLQPDGWTGVTVYFNNTPLGTCSFTLYDLSLTHGSVEYLGANAEYDVNGKGGTATMKGDTSTGFLYDVSWTDKQYDYTLECANMKYDPNLLELEKSLAKSIDSDINK